MVSNFLHSLTINM